MSGGLGLALLQGVTGYMKGRTQRREQDDAQALDASRYADTQRRQAAQDARQATMQYAQLKAMQEQSQRQAAMDAKGLREDGYTTTQSTQQQGANLAQSYGGPNPLMDAATKALGVGLQAKAKTPDLTLGGTAYVKTRDSDAALARQAEQKYATDLAGINYQRSRDDHVADTRDAQKFTREQQDRAFGQQRSLQNTALEARAAAAEQKLATATQGPKPTSSIITAIAGNQSSLNQIDQAIARLERGDGKDHIGPLRKFLPNMVSNYTDEPGADIRALIGGIRAVKYHDLTGAAVTPSEDERLQPTVPQLSDPPAIAINKLKQMRADVIARDDAIRAYYPSVGQRKGEVAPDVRNDAPPASRPPLDGGWRR